MTLLWGDVVSLWLSQAKDTLSSTLSWEPIFSLTAVRKVSLLTPGTQLLLGGGVWLDVPQVQPCHHLHPRLFVLKPLQRHILQSDRFLPSPHPRATRRIQVYTWGSPWGDQGPSTRSHSLESISATPHSAIWILYKWLVFSPLPIVNMRHNDYSPTGCCMPPKKRLMTEEGGGLIMAPLYVSNSDIYQ